MAERLAALEDPIADRARAAALRATEPPADLRGALDHHLGLAELELRAGRPQEALANLERIRQLASADPARIPPAFLHDVVELSPIANLWLAFERNCVYGPTPRCLFPTPPQGVWRERDATGRVRPRIGALPERGGRYVHGGGRGGGPRPTRVREIRGVGRLR